MIVEKAVDKSSLYGLAFVIGWIACSGYYRLPQLWQKQNQLVHVETKVVPTLKSQVNCEHWRGDKNEQVAQQAIVSADDELVPTPSVHAIAKDNCERIAKK